MSIEIQRKNTCEKYGANYLDCPENLKLGISLSIKDSFLPINGMRCKAEGDTTGWYIWTGEYCTEDPSFFKPLHASHIGKWCSKAYLFLGLAPGWIFLIHREYIDFWYDESLI